MLNKRCTVLVFSALLVVPPVSAQEERVRLFLGAPSLW